MNTPRLSTPKIGQVLTVTLPQERTRAEVTEVVDPDHIRARLVQTPMAKSHSFRLNQTVDFLRVSGVMGQEWESL